MNEWGSRTVTDVVGTAGSIGAMSLALGDEALCGSWWKCSDMKDAAEYLRAVAHGN